MTDNVIYHGHLFCGIGSGAAGFNDAMPEVGTLKGKMVCVGGIDNDPMAIEDFRSLTGVAGTVLDLFDVDQYLNFHGHMPPPGRREATTADIHRAFHYKRPNIVFLSAPCKGFSGLLSQAKSLTDKYQALNRLTLRGIWLTLEAYKDDPVELLLFENVPRIATRGRHLLDQITQLLRAYGYAVAETAHDCGEIGGLAQSRKRFLLVARHMEKVPAFLYQPDKKPLRAVGDVLGRMPLPGDPAGGPMHRIPALQWKTWVRLAFVEAGSDWRSLSKLEVEDGNLRDYLIVPSSQEGSGAYGVGHWDDSSKLVAARSGPSNGPFSIADPRFDQSTKWHDGQALGVRRWEDTTGAIAGQQNPGQGAYSVADPRHTGPAKHSNEFRIVRWDRAAQAVTSAHGTGQAVADPRMGDQTYEKTKYQVTPWDRSSRTVISASTTGDGAFAVADPRPNMARGKGDHYLTGGHYGVVRWNQTGYAVASAAGHDNGHWTVADPRAGAPTSEAEKINMPAQADKLVCRIESLDGTWHRPFTTLDLAGLQSLFDPDELWPADAQLAAEVAQYHKAHYFTMAGNSDQRWREGIGNAVPRAAAKAIGEVMGETLLLARAGVTFELSSKPIWVRGVAMALAVHQPAGELS